MMNTTKRHILNKFAKPTTSLSYSIRNFGAMNIVNQELFEHKFTNDLHFRSSFDKLKCFRVLDEEGNVINKEYEGSIDDQTLQKMFKTMVMMNEADVVFN